MSTIPEDRAVSVPSGIWQWSHEGEPWAVVEFRLELRDSSGTAWLRYDIDHDSRSTGPQEYAVSLVTTPCRFGGVRWWWLCPKTGHRVGKLYLPNGATRFLSRGAHRLAYASQHQSPVERMHARSQRLYRRLEADYDDAMDNWPQKPKGMHWRTYNALCDRLETEADGLDRHTIGVVERLMRRARR
jgi:hypothetical protein